MHSTHVVICYSNQRQVESCQRFFQYLILRYLKTDSANGQPNKNSWGWRIFIIFNWKLEVYDQTFISGSEMAEQKMEVDLSGCHQQSKIAKIEHLEITLPETNIAPENGWLEYYFPIGEAYFQGLRSLKLPSSHHGSGKWWKMAVFVKETSLGWTHSPLPWVWEED